MTHADKSEPLRDHERALLHVSRSNQLTKAQKIRLMRMIFAYSNRIPITDVPQDWPPPGSVFGLQ